MLGGGSSSPRGRVAHAARLTREVSPADLAWHLAQCCILDEFDIEIFSLKGFEHLATGLLSDNLIEYLPN